MPTSTPKWIDPNIENPRSSCGRGETWVRAALAFTFIVSLGSAALSFATTRRLDRQRAAAAKPEKPPAAQNTTLRVVPSFSDMAPELAVKVWIEDKEDDPLLVARSRRSYGLDLSRFRRPDRPLKVSVRVQVTGPFTEPKNRFEEPSKVGLYLMSNANPKREHRLLRNIDLACSGQGDRQVSVTTPEGPRERRFYDKVFVLEPLEE